MRLKATMLFGSGPKFFNQPAEGVSSDGRANGSGADYEVIRIAGYKSTVEKDPVLGYSIAINAFERKFSLTIECGAFVDRGEAIENAATILAGIK
jgi:hypothetical protein